MQNLISMCDKSPGDISVNGNPQAYQDFQSLIKKISFFKSLIKKWLNCTKKRFYSYFQVFSIILNRDVQEVASKILDCSSEIIKQAEKVIKAQIKNENGVYKKEDLIRKSSAKGTNIHQLIKKSLSSRRNTVGTSGAEMLISNHDLFLIFLKDFAKSNLSQQEISDQSKLEDKKPFCEMLIKMCKELRNLKTDRELLNQLDILEVYLKKEIKKKMVEKLLMDSAGFSDKRTISIKMITNQKNLESKEQNSTKEKTEKRCYESEIGKSIPGMISQQENSKVPIFKENFSNLNNINQSLNSINSQDIHILAFEEKNHLRKSNFSGISKKGLKKKLLNLKQKSGNLIKKGIKFERKEQTKPKNWPQELFLRSYNSNQFRNLKSPTKMMMMSQKFANQLKSGRSLISQESGMFILPNRSRNPFDHIQDSPSINKPKTKGLKRPINNSRAYHTRMSTLGYMPSNKRDTSVGFGMSVVSRDLLSLDKSVSKIKNPMIVTSGSCIKNKDPLYQLMSDFSLTKFDSGQIENRKSLLERQSTILHKQKSQVLHRGKYKGKESQISIKDDSKGHHKFSSLNLDFLRMRVQNKNLQTMNSEISNILEEDGKKFDKKKKQNRKAQKKKLKKNGSNLLMMKSLMKQGSQTNYSGMIRSYVGKMKTNSKKKSLLKKKTHGTMKKIRRDKKLKPSKTQINSKRKQFFTSKKDTLNLEGSLDHRRILKERSLGSIPCLRVYGKILKTDNKLNKLEGKKYLTNGKKMRTRLFKNETIGGDLTRKIKINKTEKKKKSKLHTGKKEISQQMKNLSCYLGKMDKRNSKGIANNKNFKYKIKTRTKRGLEGKRGSNFEAFRSDSNFNNKTKPKFLVGSGEVKNKKKKEENNHFFSYMDLGKAIPKSLKVAEKKKQWRRHQTQQI